MPKIIRTTKTRKNNQKAKRSESEQKAKRNESSRIPDSKNPIIYQGTRFQHPTTPLPAEGVKEYHVLSGTTSKDLKRRAEEEMISAMIKKYREGILPEKTKSTISDDITIIEKPEARKIQNRLQQAEVIGLTSNSATFVPGHCSSLKINHQDSISPDTPSKTLQVNSDVLVTVETSKKRNKSNVNACGFADMIYRSLPIKVKQNKASESKGEVNTNKCSIGLNKNVDLPMANISSIQLKKNISSERINYDYPSIKRPVNSCVNIEAEKHVSSENDNVNLDNSIAVSKEIKIGEISGLILYNPVKKEEVIYPDTRFPHSTTLFPATRVEDKFIQSETTSKSFKRLAEEESISAMIKRHKENDIPKTLNSTNFDDCMIIENSKAQEVEIIDLTDDSDPMIPVQKNRENSITQSIENRLRNTSNTTLQANSDVRIKVESSEQRNVINANTCGSADLNYHAISVKVEQNKDSENNYEANTGKCYVNFNKNVDIAMNNLSRVIEKSGENLQRESINCNASIEHQVDSQNNLKNSRITVSKQIDFKTYKRLGSGFHKESEVNFVSDINIKVERNENSSTSDNSASLSDFSFNATMKDFSSVNRPIKIEQNKIDENCKIGVKYMPTPMLSAQVKSEPQVMDLQKSYVNEELQNKDLSQKISQNQNTGVVTLETFSSNVIDCVGISPITNDDIFASDMQFHEPGAFRRPMLKYLNFNKKIEVFEIQYIISALKHLIEIRGEINEIEAEIVPDSIISRDNSEICLTENRKDLPDLVNEKELLKDDTNLGQISSLNFTELINSIPNITNLDSSSSRLEKSINETQYQCPLNSFGNKIQQHVSPNILSESNFNIAESCPGNDSDSQTTYFNSPMDVERSLDDHCTSIIFPSSDNDNVRSITSNSLMLKETKNDNESIPNNLLRQILSNAKSTKKSIAITNSSSSLQSSVDPVAKTCSISDESLPHSIDQINIPINKPIENLNFTTNINERNSEHTTNISENFSKRLSLSTENILKRSQGAPPTSIDRSFQHSTKRVKMSKHDSISKNESNPLGTGFTSHFPEASFSVFNSGQNMRTSPCNLQTSISISSEIALQNIGYQSLVNTISPQDSRLSRDSSPMIQRDLISPKSLNSFQINQMYPSQNVPIGTELSVNPFVNQITDSTTSARPIFPGVIWSTTELFHPTLNAVDIQQAKSNLQLADSYQHLYLNQNFSTENSHGFQLPGPGSVSFFMAQNNPYQSVADVRSHGPFLPFLSLPENTSPFSQYQHFISDQIPSPIPSGSILSYDNSSESISPGLGFNPPLPVGNPPSPPPLPTYPPDIEESLSVDTDIFAKYVLPINEKPENIKTINTPDQSSPKSLNRKRSLLPEQIRENIGKKIIETVDFYLIIIEKNIDWIHEVDKEIGKFKNGQILRTSKIGGEFHQVQSNYRNHLKYYNTYFPLLMLECFSKISTDMKQAQQKKRDRYVCKIDECKPEHKFVCITCCTFICPSDLENIPKEGNVILVKFATIQEGSIQLLGYVRFSGTREYSHKHDRKNEMLKYVNVSKRTDLIKFKIIFNIVFDTSDINLHLPIQISKLINIKKDLLLNEALIKLRNSPLCNTILGQGSRSIKNFTLPRRQDINSMTTIVQEIVHSLNPLSPQLTVVKSAPFTDSVLAIVQIVENIQKFKIPGKILICVRTEMLCDMGMNLKETSSNLIIINRDRENVDEKLQSRVLDVRISHLSKAQKIEGKAAKCKVLQEADVLLAVTGICFYEDVLNMVNDLIFCIIHDAHSFTEPESLLPLRYGIRHLLLFGDPDRSCTVNSKLATSLGYNKSLFKRVYAVS